MAGAGYKLFNTGDVLLASEVNTYLQQQVTMVFANATARTSALSGVLAEGMMSYLQDTNTVEVYNGTSWVNVGNAGDITEVQAGTGISVASGTGPIPVVTSTVATTFDAKGDLVVGTGADTFAKLSVGTNGHTLVADSSVSPTGLKWAVDPVADIVTTAGDILYATAADTLARLGIGTAGQVLKVNSGATAPEWGAAASGALTKITGNTFSNQSSVTIDSIFSSTYRAYMMVLAVNATSPATNASDMQLQFRYSTTTLTGSNYYGAQYNLTRGNAESTNGYSAATQITMAPDVGGPDNPSFYTIFFRKVGSTSERAHLYGTYLGGGSTDSGHFSGQTDTNQTYTGILLKASANNIDGNYTVYGLEN